MVTTIGVYQNGNSPVNPEVCHIGGRHYRLGNATVPGMVTRIHRGARGHLYIAEWRRYRDLTQEKLGSRVHTPRHPDGVGKNTVSRWENGERRPNLDTQAAIAEALDIRPDDLWRPPPRGDQPPPPPSLDAELAGVPEDRRELARELALDVVRRMRRVS